MQDHLQAIRKLGELSNDGVFIYNIIDNNFIYTNKNFTDIFKITGKTYKEQAEVVYTSMLTEDSTWLHARYEELVEKSSLNDTEFRLKFGDGLTHHFSCDAFLITESDVVGFVKDVTQLKEHENYIVEYTAKKDAFLDMITHNLSGPLAISLDILKWMQQPGRSNGNEQAAQLLTLLQDSVQQCIDIVDDFLKEEHVESQSVYVRKTRINILQKVHAVLDKLREMNPDKQFKLITDLENVNLNTDSVKFFQVVHNLLSNAIKFTGENGNIEMTITEEESAFVFGIRDTGVGIPANLQQYIFDKRTFAGREGLKGERSNGIGLSIVKKLVELMDGEIWFESQEKIGTAFFFRLPKD